MADDLHNYNLQLQQVQTALLADPQNKELQKLKLDLQEIIDLTLELKTKTEESTKRVEYHVVPISNCKDEDEITQSLLAVEKFVTMTKKKKLWRVGDMCMAKWGDVNQYYNARIDAINPQGQVTVTFEAYHNRGITTLSELKEFTGEKRPLTEAEKLKRAKLNNRDYVRKKKLKKIQRVKELEEERETEKNKWIAFNHKAIKTKKFGLNNKSIFASPEFVNGRVGIGTCGISGKPMTEFSIGDKYKRGQKYS